MEGFGDLFLLEGSEESPAPVSSSVDCQLTTIYAGKRFLSPLACQRVYIKPVKVPNQFPMMERYFHQENANASLLRIYVSKSNLAH